MQHKLFNVHTLFHNWRFVVSEEMVALVLALFIFIMPAAATTRLTERSLFMQTTEPGATTNYTIAFNYMTPSPIGSIDLQFCNSPIPYEPCVTPTGLDISAATLSGQTGETGYSISTHTANHIVLSRLPSAVASGQHGSYTFSNIVNPTDQSKAFAIRLRTHAATITTGEHVDFGSVRGQVGKGIVIETQVPPMLIFCMAEQVADNCDGTNDNYYKDMGDLTPTDTLTAQSQMAVGTNASGGFAITAYGNPPTAGTNVVDALTMPTESKPGTTQFGINLVENTAPAVGSNPVGTWANAQPTTDYGQSNMYKYRSGDVVASSPNVSLMKKFTVSYIFNSSPNLKAGVYTTTINFVASGRF
jgi:hypothetical protein